LPPFYEQQAERLSPTASRRSSNCVVGCFAIVRNDAGMYAYERTDKPTFSKVDLYIHVETFLDYIFCNSVGFCGGLGSWSLLEEEKRPQNQDVTTQAQNA
jgi:hypothetical protein